MLTLWNKRHLLKFHFIYNISIYHSLVAGKHNRCSYLTNHLSFFVPQWERNLVSFFPSIQETRWLWMHVVYILFEMDFTITKWCGKSQCKETTISPTMLKLNGWKIYLYFLLRRKKDGKYLFLCATVCRILLSVFQRPVCHLRQYLIPAYHSVQKYSHSFSFLTSKSS